MRRLRQWWPVIAAVIFLAIIALGAFAVYLAATFDSKLFEGTWRRAGDPGASMTVSYESNGCTISFADDRSDASLTVPAAVGPMTLEATLPPTTDPALLGGQTIGKAGLPITLTGDPGHGPESLVVSSQTGPDHETTVLWTYGPSGFLARWQNGWVAEVVLVCAFLVVAILLFGSRAEERSRGDKARMVAVVVVGAVLIYDILIASDLALWWADPRVLVAVCWALFLATVVPGQVPAVGEGLGVIFIPARRRTFRQDHDSQNAQVERGDAMDRLLGEVIDERGDRDLIEGADDDT